ncbi:DegT/DnrJ/EryC1/StrS family aminotransferase [Flavobacteriaceae bacterium]|nr:DegT/DnrJ/EryC1/StrS family aminotransferase [Flavobacteriaceae bacterium]
MKTIQMVDLKGQYEKIKPEVDAAIMQVIETSSFIRGAAVKSFQDKLQMYLGIEHVIPCGNGTDALQLALMALDLKPGDEVITTDFTFAATVEVIGLMNLKPVLVDIDPEDFNISVEAIKKAIGPKTKAIIPVHLFGKSCDMEEIMELANKNNLFVIEDSAQGLGGSFQFANNEIKKLGTIGHIGTTSFFPSKNLGAYGDGGAVFTSDPSIAERIRSLANHGMSKRYHYDRIGINSRLDSMQAAILNCKLPHLDRYANSRRTAARFYNEALEGINEITCPYFENSEGYFDHVFHQYTLRVSNGHRDRLKTYLADLDIPTAIYYPKALHTQKAYEGLLDQDLDLRACIKASQEVLSLPMHTELDQQQLSFITTSIKEYFKAI